MEDYNKIIESLKISFIKAKSINVNKPVGVRPFMDVENTVIALHKGSVYFGEDKKVLQEGEVLFIPAGNSIPIQFGQGENVEILSQDQLLTRQHLYKSAHEPDSYSGEDFYSQITFAARVFGSVSFFKTLDIPPFVLHGRPHLIDYVNGLVRESRNPDDPGRDRLQAALIDCLTIEIVRYILQNSMFVEKLATNSTYFKDPRLIHIFTYIRKNLSGDLSNKTLAKVAEVSEDYVGQYFKMLTGINPQDYIEYQRMEKAVGLLRTTKLSIRDIGKDVGYRDTAYFCRRFKMMFGIPAGKMRKRDSLMNPGQKKKRKKRTKTVPEV